MLIIRFQRRGRKNQPTFRIVLAEKTRSVSKKFIEVLGHYNPATKEFNLKDEERVRYWLSQHVELSPSVQNLLIDKGLVQGKKVKAWQPKKKAAEEKPPAEKSEEPAVENAEKAETEKAENQETANEVKKEEREPPADEVTEEKGEQPEQSEPESDKEKEEAKAEKPDEQTAEEK